MILGIDASNIRRGGGVTHLVELLNVAKPNEFGFEKVLVWASQATLDLIMDHTWLQKCTEPVMEAHYLRRALWQRNKLGGIARANKCDLLFVPGGSFATTFRPIVTMNRNLLPFEWQELRRFGLGRLTIKYLLLRWAQSKSYKNANGVIFLTRYAKRTVLKVTGALSGDSVIIPHGIGPHFFHLPREQKLLSSFTVDHPLRLIYVSIIDTYKHQWHVAKAVAALREEKIPIAIDFIGPAYPPSLRRLQAILEQVDYDGEFIRYLGTISHTEIHKICKQADVAIFASSCEAFGQILTEYMAAGLPIACANRSSMPELLGGAGVYFDPENSDDIARHLRRLINSQTFRTCLVKASFERAQAYTWKRCADETFGFLSRIASMEHQ